MNNQSNNSTKRPRWARKLTVSEWNDLKLCQGTGTPKLTQLLRDIDHQADSMEQGGRVPCWACWGAVKSVRPNHPALQVIESKRTGKVSA